VFSWTKFTKWWVLERNLVNWCVFLAKKIYSCHFSIYWTIYVPYESVVTTLSKQQQACQDYLSPLPYLKQMSGAKICFAKTRCSYIICKETSSPFPFFSATPSLSVHSGTLSGVLKSSCPELLEFLETVQSS
jgi:hypothetical protein